MIIVMKPGVSREEDLKIAVNLESMGLRVHESVSPQGSVIGVLGDTSLLDPEMFRANAAVASVEEEKEPFKLANRLFHPENSIIDVSGVPVGGRKLAVIAGPCSVENPAQIASVAWAVKAAGACMLRGGAFKPRTSPYSFQGLREEGLDLLAGARQFVHMPIVTELMSADHLDRYIEDVDLIQVGARNMQNFELLKALGRTRKPILLKRGLSATVEEWLMSAEYIMAGGNENVILCERGIRTFETCTRNTLDLSAVLAVKKMSHLPVLVDPSHASGKRWMVERLAMAAVAVGADGLMIEVHNDPDHALCDGAQSLRPEQFAALMDKLRILAPAVGREV